MNFHSNRRLTAHFSEDEKSFLPCKFLSDWANRMNNEKTLFTDLIGSIYSETKTEKEIFPRPRGPE